MSSQIDAIAKKASDDLKEVKSHEALEALRVAYLGKKGILTGLMEQLKSLPSDEKKDFGKRVNELKSLIESSIQTLRTQIQTPAASANIFDPTLPGIFPKLGGIHPISQTIRDICAIFQRLGFQIVDGPEIETEFHNFTALNIPLDHPSRESFDTFYTDHGHLLRSQTSTVQIRMMKKTKPPLRILAPGRVYRPDTVDASHSFMFHQIEGLYVDKKVRFSDLKGFLNLFLRELFGSSIKTRFRPHFFPFTEPSVEVDILWKQKTWLEILGAGSVDPHVFKAVGYDPTRYQGFAFGLGVERIAMLRYGITDIRYFYENDSRFLRQFP